MARSPAIVWLRRDLRTADHPALAAAVAAGAAARAPVLALFVVDPRLTGPSGPARLAFLWRCLRDLRASGVPVVLRHGDPATVVPAVAREVGAGAVHVSADFGPYGRERDRRVAAALADDGRRLVANGSAYAVDPGTVRRSDGSPFKVFTPFSRVWGPLAFLSAPVATPDPSVVEWHTGAASERVPDEPDPATVPPRLPPAGETAAHDRLNTFLADPDGARRYQDTRDDPAADATSRLSPYLKFGCLHPRQVLAALTAVGGAGPDALRRELCWREFYADVLWHVPSSARTALQQPMGAMRVDDGPTADERFAAWAEGRTGFPFVDAGLRQLREEGWMHNRVRMAVASFLVKDLHLDWRRGARHFMAWLVDGDLASNQHGWQWTAGTGTDAAPYFRVFNPTSQGRRFDPDGVYVRRHVPELAHVPAARVHDPGPVLGYDPPIVDHAEERAEALRRYAEVRGRL